MFHAYLLHCRGGAYYCGHTDDLDRRIAQHQSGAIPGFTADRLPVTLVWTDSFATRDEAKAAEQRIKGWSRAKKMALIRGDWQALSQHARSRQTDPINDLPARPERSERERPSNPHPPQAPPTNPRLP